MAEYTSAVALAKRLLTKKGDAVTVSAVHTTTPADPLRPWAGPTTSANSFNTFGVFVDPRNSEDNFDFAEKMNYRSPIRRTDLHVFIPASDCTFVPAQGNRVTRGSLIYNVVTVSPVKPGPTPIAYILQLQV